jgi:tetratricopeptide (TPR) repeat protein
LSPIKALLVLRTEGKDTVSSREVTLLGRADTVLLTQGTQAGGASYRIDCSQIVRCEFLFEYDNMAVATALQNKDWAAAVRVLTPIIRPALPYLDIPDNNGLELAMDLGMYMVSSADRERRVAADAAARERANKQYAAAYDVFRYAANADWTPGGQVAALKGCLALLAQNQVEKALGELREIEPPEPDEMPYGHYWLVEGEILRRGGKIREALDAVVKSVAFANKDVETFPLALLLTADCYAGLGQHHRARDVYYEIAVLFGGTDWALDALIGLTKIMDGKKTLEKEEESIENVFFNMTEDMNKLSEELIKARTPPKPKKGSAEAKAGA